MLEQEMLLLPLSLRKLEGFEELCVSNPGAETDTYSSISQCYMYVDIYIAEARERGKWGVRV